MPTAEKPALYLQMALDIEERIATGDLRSGERLPSFGRMRKEYGANQVTVERVYAVLDKKGLIRREAKRGIFVAEPPPKARPVIEIVTRFDLQCHEYYIHLLQGIQEEAYRHGVEIVLSRDDAMLDPRRVDGIILAPPSEAAMKTMKASDATTPCVMLGQKFPAEMPSIAVDEEAGVAMAVRHLVELGHRRIGYLSSEKNRNEHSPPPYRIDAFKRALEDACIEPDDKYIWPLRLSAYEAQKDFVAMGREKMELWLENGFRNLGCTALLMQNDEAAIGAIHALEDAGLRVPDDVSIVGFDGLIMGTRVRPRLTTVQVPLVEIGSAGVAAIMRCLEKRRTVVGAEKEKIQVTSVTIAPTFVAGASTQALR